MSASDRPRRVAIVTSSLRGGGLERMVRDLALALHARGDEPHVFVLRGAIGAYAADLSRAAIPVHDCREGRLRIPGIPRRLIGALRAVRPAVIHAHSGTWLPSAVATLRVDAPLVFTDHGRYPPESRTLRTIQRWCLGRTARVVAVTRSLAEYLVEFLGPPVAPIVIENGIDLAAYRVDDPAVRDRLRAEWGFDASHVVLCAIGRFAPVKNHRGLLEAFAAALVQAPALRLVLLGEGPLQPESELLARELAVADRVRFLGFRSDVRDCLAASDCFVNASTTEALPVSLLEAMAVGVPTVATAVGGVPDALGTPPAGLLVTAGDTSALAGALARIGTDADERGTFARRAGIRAQDFSLDDMTDHYRDLYAALDPDSRS